MRVVVIEDEPPASKKLCGYITKYDAGIEIAATLESVEKGLRWFAENRIPDLVISDIELLDGNVFRLLESGVVSCPVIFTTAYDQFWLQAFELNGIAYLLKPFSYEKFVGAMRKFEGLKQNMMPVSSSFWRDVQRSVSGPKYKERLVIRVRGGIHLLETRRIAFIKTVNEIPFAFDANGTKFPLKETLNELEQILDPGTFFRVNRGEIVSINFIERLEPDFKDRLVISLHNLKTRLVSSSSRTPRLRKWLESSSGYE